MNIEPCEIVQLDPDKTKKTDVHQLLEEMAEAVAAKDQLLVCYRTGKRPSEALFKKLDKAEKTLKKYRAFKEEE